MAKEAKKDTDVITDTADAGTPVNKFSKEQILASATYASRRDLLSVLLEDSKCYTIAEVQDIMAGWFKKGAK